ncbi:MAG: LysR family transcriptional regulator [Myxococcales bacterium]|nr:LysR family transcriptional regulator [Myxococcales bacterium]
MFTIRQLEIFLSIAEHEHVTNAARALGMTQSAASIALAELEKDLGVALFERLGRGLKLNERGRLLEREARFIVERLGSLSAIVREDADRVVGELHVGASSTIGIYLLPAIISRFVHRWPDATIKLEVGNSEQIREWLLSRHIDVGLVEGPVHDDQIEAESWLDDQLTVFASPDYPLDIDGNTVRWADISAERWILREDGSGTQEVFLRALETLGSTVRPYMTFGHTEAIKHAVEAGLGLGCLSRLTIERELQRGWLRAIDVTDLDLSRRLTIVSRKGCHPSRLRDAFLEEARTLVTRAVVGFGI